MQTARDPVASPSLASTLSVAEACDRVQTKDISAFEKLYEHYKEPLGKRLVYLVGNKEDAYELYQETFLRVWRNLPAREPIGNFEAWLYSVAGNLAIDHLRHRKRLEFLPFPENEAEEYACAEIICVSGHEESVCEREWIKQALERLSPQYRTCIVLQEIWGYSQREIARLLDISEKSVSANVSRGRAQLRVAYRGMMHHLKGTKKDPLCQESKREKEEAR